MKILVTGGGGYLGSVLVPHLLDEGHEVTVLDNFMYGQTALLECCFRKALTIVRGDARDSALLREQVPAADVLIPLACLTGAPACARDPLGAESIICDALKRLLELRSREQLILYPTTNSGYGIGEEGVLCTEESPLRPVSLYGRLKMEAERLVREAGNAICFRLATAFGVSPRMRLDLLVNDFVYRAVTDRFVVLYEAHFKRNYIHVRDVARVFLHALDKAAQMRDQVFNVGLSDANLSKLELCRMIQGLVPDFYFVEAQVGKDPDQRNYLVSNARIEAAGFRPQVGLHDGILELVKGYQVLRRTSYANA